MQRAFGMTQLGAACSLLQPSSPRAPGDAGLRRAVMGYTHGFAEAFALSCALDCPQLSIGL